MIGVEPLKAGSGSFHATFSVALHVVGRPFSVLTPSSDGPRHCGQLASSDALVMVASNPTVRTCLRMVQSKAAPLGMRPRAAAPEHGRRRR